MDVVISEHARFEMIRRRVSEEMMLNVIQDPQQIVELSKKRTAYQSRCYDPAKGKEMLLRAICEERHGTIFVVAVYKTSKVEKY